MPSQCDTPTVPWTRQAAPLAVQLPSHSLLTTDRKREWRSLYLRSWSVCGLLWGGHQPPKQLKQLWQTHVCNFNLKCFKCVSYQEATHNALCQLVTLFQPCGVLGRTNHGLIQATVQLH